MNLYISRRWFYLLLFIMLMVACTPAKSKSVNIITQDILVQRIQSDNPPLILDVRTAREYAQGHIPGAINIEHTQLEKQIDKLAQHRHQEVVIHCESGGRANIAEEILRNRGFDKILHLEGDMRAWRDNQLPVE